MFANIGGKIKTFASVCTWMGIIGSVLAGLGIMDNSVLLGVLAIALGSFVSWVGSFMVYGFGQLIENTDKLVEAEKQNAKFWQNKEN